MLRAKGLVIVDENGKERILIGAPIPPARNRVRTDTARVRKLWAQAWGKPEEYMNWYKNYRHSANGIVILDENGYDRLALGQDVPDPNIGRRIGLHTGMVFNDESGYERGGLGILKLKNGKKRVVLGLDGENGNDATGISIMENGQSGFWAAGSKGKHIFVGAAPDSALLANPFLGVLVSDRDKPLYNLNLAARDSIIGN